MANKTWEYVVTFQHPDDYEKTPMQRRTCSRPTTATSAMRAINKVKKDVAEAWEIEARYVEILDACRVPFAVYPEGTITAEGEE